MCQSKTEIQKEIWDNFETIYRELQEHDEIYFDITHSFRYLPMLLMILLSYSEFLKKTKVMSVTYGNYEMSKKNDGFAPIMDLMPLVLLKIGHWLQVISNSLETLMLSVNYVSNP